MEHRNLLSFFSVCLPIVDLVPGKTNRKKSLQLVLVFKRETFNSLYIYICVSDSLGICVWDKVTTPGLVVLALSYGFGSCRFLEFMTLKQFLQFGRISLVILGLGFFSNTTILEYIFCMVLFFEVYKHIQIYIWMSMGKRKCFNGDKFFSVCTKCVKQIYISLEYFSLLAYILWVVEQRYIQNFYIYVFFILFYFVFSFSQ